MLDVIERILGRALDDLDSGQSMKLHGRLFPRAKPQSICSRVIASEWWALAWLIGVWHCMRSWERYH